MAVVPMSMPVVVVVVVVVVVAVVVVVVAVVVVVVVVVTVVVVVAVVVAAVPCPACWSPPLLSDRYISMARAHTHSTVLSDTIRSRLHCIKGSVVYACHQGQ
jgi:hypothetical protein